MWATGDAHRSRALKQLYFLALSGAVLIAAAPTTARSEGCRLALALALDVSSSVDAREYDLQRLGVAAALDAPEVRHAILRGAPGYVSLAIYEWSGARQHALQLDWVDLTSETAIDTAIERLLNMQRSFDEFPTSMGPALAFGSQLMARAPTCKRHVIDMSGDGVHNDHYGPRQAYRYFALDNVTVNGLVVLGDDADVLDWYRTQVLHGPGAFLITANGFSDFKDAMTRKLYREVNDIVLGLWLKPEVRR